MVVAFQFWSFAMSLMVEWLSIHTESSSDWEDKSMPETVAPNAMKACCPADGLASLFLTPRSNTDMLNNGCGFSTAGFSYSDKLTSPCVSTNLV